MAEKRVGYREDGKDRANFHVIDARHNPGMWLTELQTNCIADEQRVWKWVIISKDRWRNGLRIVLSMHRTGCGCDATSELCMRCGQTGSFCQVDLCVFVCCACKSGTHDEWYHCKKQTDAWGGEWRCVYCCGHDGECGERAGRVLIDG